MVAHHNLVGRTPGQSAAVLQTHHSVANLFRYSTFTRQEGQVAKRIRKGRKFSACALSLRPHVTVVAPRPPAHERNVRLPQLFSTLCHNLSDCAWQTVVQALHCLHDTSTTEFTWIDTHSAFALRCLQTIGLKCAHEPGWPFVTGRPFSV